MYVSLLGPLLFCIRLIFCIDFRVPEGAQGSQGTQGVLQTGNMCCAQDSVPHKFHNTPTKGPQIVTTTLHRNRYVCMQRLTRRRKQQVNVPFRTTMPSHQPPVSRCSKKKENQHTDDSELSQSNTHRQNHPELAEAVTLGASHSAYIPCP